MESKRWPQQQRREEYKKEAPYHGKRPSTSYIPTSQAVNANSHGLAICDDHTRNVNTGSRDYRGLVSDDTTQFKADRHCGIDSVDRDPDGDSSFHWDEEATLLSELMETGPEQNGDEYLDAMVETLQAPFTDQGKRLKKEIAQTLVPTHNRVKAVIQVLEKNVDVTYGQGLALFNAACKDIEKSMYAQHIHMKEVYEEITGNIERAYKELEREYHERDELWLSIHSAVASIVTPALHNLKESPDRIESAITKLEKSAKAST
ncbi:hypothetical protein JR316_0003376 [Psilocybe cubensis]|uniref:Uncharacterized protein n=2 Tax=Psilocybe cubensis TaxID=181762 RepID=A0ACB8H7Y0_PSICU|nr:hypothetical protein JR316_0003376 [Psilocybe cubensis]KAH9483898.1 hypothetical protein JR316_0003376 [Psilocybe cubensis]